MIIDRSQVDLGGIGDDAERDAVIRVIRDQPFGRIENSLFRGKGIA